MTETKKNLDPDKEQPNKEQPNKEADKSNENANKEKTPQSVTDETHQKVKDKFGQHITQEEEKNVKPKPEEPKEKDNKETVPKPPEATPDAPQPQPEAPKQGFFSKLGHGVLNVFKNIGNGIKNVIIRNNPNDPLGFGRQAKPDIPKTPLLTSPFYLVGDMLDGTVMNIARRGYEIFSPFAKLPGKLKDKKLGAQAKEIASAFGQSIKGIINTPFKGIYEAYLGLIQKPAGRIARIIERIPLVGGLAGATLEGIAILIGTPIKWISEIPEDIITLAKGSGEHGGGSSGHNGHTATDKHGPKSSDKKPSGNEHTTAEHDKEEKTSHEPTEKATEGPKNKEKILKAIKDADYGANENNHNNTIGKYLTIDTEKGKITAKKDADIFNLRGKLIKDDTEREKWTTVINKLIKFIRRNAYDKKAIDIEQLKEFGFDKSVLAIFEETMSEEDFKEVMETPLK